MPDVFLPLRGDFREEEEDEGVVPIEGVAFFFSGLRFWGSFVLAICTPTVTIKKNKNFDSSNRNNKQN